MPYAFIFVAKWAIFFVLTYWIDAILILIGVGALILAGYLLFKALANLNNIFRYARILALSGLFGIPTIAGGLSYIFKDLPKVQNVHTYLATKLDTALSGYINTEHGIRTYLGLSSKEVLKSNFGYESILITTTSDIQKKHNQTKAAAKSLAKQPQATSKNSIKPQSQMTSKTPVKHPTTKETKQTKLAVRQQAQDQAAREAEEQLRLFNEQLKRQQQRQKNDPQIEVLYLNE